MYNSNKNINLIKRQNSLEYDINKCSKKRPNSLEYGINKYINQKAKFIGIWY